MNFNIFNSLILAGVIQGLVFGGVWLFNKKYRAKSTYFLIALILVYSLSNLQYYLLDTGFVSTEVFYSYLYIGWSILMPTLFLFYGLSIMDSSLKLSMGQKLLYLPFVVSFLLGCSYKFQVVVQGKESGFSIFFDNLVAWAELAAIGFSILVVIYLYIKVTRFEKEQRFSISKIKPQLKWFKAILIFQFFAILLWTYSELVYGYSTENYYFYPVWIVLAIIIYWMGHIGIYKYGIEEQRKKIRKISQDRSHSITVEKPKSDHIAEMENFIIREKNFLDTSLTLELLANRLNLSKGYLSKMINTELGVSFSEYLNKLRVEEAKSYLTNPEFSNYTLVAIGLEAGFNSKSAFNATFKKITGLTPSEYQRKHTNAS